MIILGLVLVGLAAAATAGIVVGGGQQTAVEVGGLRVETTTSGFFLFGFGLAIALVGGIQLVVVGLKHWRRRRQEIETLRSQAQPAPVPAAASAPAAGATPAAAGAVGAEPAGAIGSAPDGGPTEAEHVPASVEGRHAGGDQGKLEAGRTEPSPVGTPPALPDEEKR